MDLFQLECFISVKKNKSFSLAADELFISQSCISKHIAKLEKELSMKLFYRNPNGITLTEAGKELYTSAQLIIAEYYSVKKRLESLCSNGIDSTLNISSINHLCKIDLKKPLSLFLEKHNNVKIQISEGDTRKVMNDLINSKADIGVIAYCKSPFNGYHNLKDFPIESFSFDTLIKDEYYLAVNENHPFANEENITWEQLSKTNLILLDDSYSINFLVKNCFSSLGLSPNISAEIANSDVIMGLINENCGVSLFSSQVIDQQSNIRKVKLKNPISRDTTLVTPNKINSSTLKAFKDTVLKYYLG